MCRPSTLAVARLAVACALSLRPARGLLMRPSLFAGVMDVVTMSGESMELRDSRGGKNSTDYSVTGGKTQMAATVAGRCDGDYYSPSDMELAWLRHPIEWTASQDILCERLGSAADRWLAAIAGEENASAQVFSTLCPSSKEPQLMEPLAGILRSPRVFCPDAHTNVMDVDFLLLADARSAGVPEGARRLFFDAGGSNFNDALRWFTEAYGARGIAFDHIFVWEAQERGTEEYWRGVPPEVRATWEPRLTFYDGVPVSADPSDTDNNVVQRITRECSPDDFCSWKLDIDAASVELQLVEQLLGSPEALRLVDEFFFEHHVHGLMEQAGWAGFANGTFADSYEIFSNLRNHGVRAHSWV